MASKIRISETARVEPRSRPPDSSKSPDPRHHGLFTDGAKDTTPRLIAKGFCPIMGRLPKRTTSTARNHPQIRALRQPWHICAPIRSTSFFVAIRRRLFEASCHGLSVSNANRSAALGAICRHRKILHLTHLSPNPLYITQLRKSTFLLPPTWRIPGPTTMNKPNPIRTSIRRPNTVRFHQTMERL